MYMRYTITRILGVEKGEAQNIGHSENTSSISVPGPRSSTASSIAVIIPFATVTKTSCPYFPSTLNCLDSLFDPARYFPQRFVPRPRMRRADGLLAGCDCHDWKSPRPTLVLFPNGFRFGAPRNSLGSYESPIDVQFCDR